MGYQAQAQCEVLGENWHWKQRDDSTKILLDELSGQSWLPAKEMPSDIFIELFAAGKIPDPFLGFNEHKVQWVGERDWLYKGQFSFDAARNNVRQVELVFMGLDTFCDVYLNEAKILSADNMFRSYSIALDTRTLKAKNLLLLHFKSAKDIAKSLERQFGRVRAGSCNLGDPSRVYVRKAQYHWRWDWGPELMTCGPYRPIHLLTYTTRVLELRTHAIVSSDLSTSFEADVTLTGDISSAVGLRILLKDPEGGVVREESRDLTVSAESIVKLGAWEFGKAEIKLWWPVGYGDQILYAAEVQLLGEDGLLLDQITKTVGFRRVELVQEPLTEPDRYGTGTTFLFQINNVRIFIGGSNWIPADNFLIRITPEKYRAWLQLLKDGNQNMVRLWGGGVYEPDVFYDLCDELGILVWQDFQFACGVYPAHDEFVASVKAEAEDNVKRLRHHPSLVLLCGNNEDYQQVLQWGGIGDLPARKIYEEVLPEVVTRLTDPEIPYHRGSPYGGKGWDTSDPTVGDVHQWNVWAGTANPYQDYDIMGGRFISEFGMPSLPDVRTVDYWLDGDQSQRYSQSKLMAQHNKAGLHERRFANVMNDNFRLTGDLEAYIYHTQIMQSEAVGGAYRVWKREWRGKGKEYTAGVLVWQLNDCWPATSWAIVDYFLRPKPVYYTMARELRPFTVGILRTVEKNRETDRPRQFYEFGAFQSRGATIDVWATNATLTVRSAVLTLRCVDLESQWTHEEKHDVVLNPNQSTEILSIPCPCPSQLIDSSTEPPVTTSFSVVVAAKLLDRDSGAVIARFADWPQPYRYIDFPDPGLRIHESDGKILVTVEQPLKGLVFGVDADGEEPKWSDNNLDVMPGDPQEIVVKNLNSRGLKVSYMGKEQPTAVRLQ